MEEGKEPVESEQEKEFELDESKIRTGPSKEPMTIATDSGRNRKEATWWASYDGGIEGYHNVSGYGMSEDEAKQNLREKFKNL